MCGGEAVPAAVGHSGGPPEVDPGDGAGDVAQRLVGVPGPRRRLGRFLLGDQCLPLLQDALREADRARVPRHQVDPGPDLLGELGEPPLVGRGAHVDQGHDDVPLAGVALVQGADGVEDGVAGGELVVDEDEGRARVTAPFARQQVRVLRQQQVRGGVGVRFLEAAGPRHAFDGAPGRVEVGRRSEPVGDGVPESGGRLRVAEDHRVPCAVLAEEVAHPAAEFEAGAVHDRGALRHVLAEHVGHEQMCPLGVAPQGEAQQLTELPVARQLDAQPLRDPATRPHHVRRFLPLACHARPLTGARPSSITCPRVHPHRRLRSRTARSAIPRRSPPAVRRSRRPPSPRRRPPPAAACVRPRRGGASPRSSCSCTRSAAPRRRRAPAAGCPARR